MTDTKKLKIWSDILLFILFVLVIGKVAFYLGGGNDGMTLMEGLSISVQTTPIALLVVALCWIVVKVI